MPKTINNISIDEAFKILDCKNIDYFKGLFSDADYASLLSNLEVPAKYKTNDSAFSQALQTFTGEPSLATMMIWNIVGSITIAIPALSIIAIVCLGLLVPSALIYFLVTYHEIKRK